MGIITSVFSQTFPPRSKFNLEDIPDLTGKVIIVTGANAGVSQNNILSRT
jgi:retinol dehydrogenase-12